MIQGSPKCFAVGFKDLNRWSVGSFREIGWRWPADYIRPLSDALIQKLFDVEKESADPKSLKMVTLHFDGEMELRHQHGNKPIKGRLWWADPGDVIYSKIDVRHGAIGIVPHELGRVCVTSEFPVYNDLRELNLVIPPLSTQQKIVETVAEIRKSMAQLKAEAEKKAQQAKADVEAMILGIKSVPDAN